MQLKQKQPAGVNQGTAIKRSSRAAGGAPARQLDVQRNGLCARFRLEGLCKTKIKGLASSVCLLAVHRVRAFCAFHLFVRS